MVWYLLGFNDQNLMVGNRLVHHLLRCLLDYSKIHSLSMASSIFDFVISASLQGYLVHECANWEQRISDS